MSSSVWSTPPTSEMPPFLSTTTTFTGTWANGPCQHRDQSVCFFSLVFLSLNLSLSLLASPLWSSLDPVRVRVGVTVTVRVSVGVSVRVRVRVRVGIRVRVGVRVKGLCRILSNSGKQQTEEREISVRASVRVRVSLRVRV